MFAGQDLIVLGFELTRPSHLPVNVLLQLFFSRPALFAGVCRACMPLGRRALEKVGLFTLTFFNHGLLFI